ncbi:MAG TPA: hypothetical protein VGE92_14155, partial [Steroidobacteraceae bacterium]
SRTVPKYMMRARHSVCATVRNVNRRCRATMNARRSQRRAGSRPSDEWRSLIAAPSVGANFAW